MMNAMYVGQRGAAVQARAGSQGLALTGPFPPPVLSLGYLFQLHGNLFSQIDRGEL